MSMSSPASPRRMVIWFDRLSSDRLTSHPPIRSAGASPDQPHQPLALYVKDHGAFLLSAVNASAEALGLRRGMALADACAMAPSLEAHLADQRADAALLEQIAAWCERFTPIVALDPPDGLVLDLSGSAALFGGEAALLALLRAQLARRGLSARIAIAPNSAAAWALAHYAAPMHFQRPGADGMRLAASDLPAVLAALPIAALRLDPAATALLKRLGLKRIGQIADAPRAALAARAGQAVLNRLDLAWGRTEDLLTPRRAPPEIHVQRVLAEPVTTLEGLLQIIRDLCAALNRALSESGRGAQSVRLSAFMLDGGVRRFELGFSRPERAGELMARLLKERLERIAPSFETETGFESFRLEALGLAPWIWRPLATPSEAGDPEILAAVIERIAARLGRGRLGALGARHSHLPEKTTVWRTGPEIAGKGVPAADGAGPTAIPADQVMRRPLTLLRPAQAVDVISTVPDGPPFRFFWRRQTLRVVKAEGPERLAPNWLDAPDGLEGGDQGQTRDYFRVEDDSGRRYWLYREGFHDGPNPPRWFVHGLFA